MSLKEELKEIIYVLNYIEKEKFKGTYSAEICGRIYRRNDWRKYKNTLEKIIENIDKQKNASAKYLTKNKEYNRKMRLLSYYRTKENKTTSDFIKMENLKRDLDNYLKEKEEKKEKQQEKELKEVQEALMNLSNYDDWR